jgi:dTDP-glucose 4,6-dehydratase
MKILLTGGAGFIGGNLVRRLLTTTPHEVVNVDKLTYAGNLKSIQDCLGHPRHRFVQADIADAPVMSTLFEETRPDAVMHLAAESHVDRSISGPGEFMQTNVIGTFVLLQAARAFWLGLDPAGREAFRFLHVSTDEVFGSLKPGDPAFCETTPYDPRSPYSASKAASDHLVRAWHHTYGLPVLVTHCSNNYGPFQLPEKLIPRVILTAMRGEPVPVYGTGENIRDWIHVSDHVAALCRVLEKGRPGGTYLIGAGNERRNLDLVRSLCRLLDELNPRPKVRRHEDLITFVADRPGHDFRYAIDSSKLRAELAWAPEVDPENGLRKTVEWYLDQYSESGGHS